MRRIHLLLSLTLLYLNQVQAQTSSTMEQTFIRLETEWMNAWKNKDETKARRMMADDFTLTSSLSEGELVDKKTWIQKAIHQYDCKSFKIEKLQVRVYENTAVLNIWFWQDASANGKDWSGKFLLTDIWVKGKEDWKVVARHSSWLKNK